MHYWKRVLSFIFQRNSMTHFQITCGRRLGEGGNGQYGSIHVLLVGKSILSLLGGKDFGMGGDALCLGHGRYGSIHVLLVGHLSIQTIKPRTLLP
jgi:hypothetical protein